MEDRIKQLENTVEQLTKKIVELENLFSCQLCGEVDFLHTCYFCGNKVCKYCHIQSERKNYRGETVIILRCKWCDQ